MSIEDYKKEVKTPMEYVGEFENVYGEEYVITRLKLKGLTVYFIAGNETDWETYTLDTQHLRAYKEFSFSDEEREGIKRVLGKI